MSDSLQDVRHNDPWRLATPPDDVADAEPVVVREVADATLTGVQVGRLRTSGPVTARNWLSGAVYDAAGRLVPESQRLWRGDPKSPLPADPGEIEVPDPSAVLPGRWLYGGHWMHHFGHFLLELVTNLWPEPGDHPVSGIVLHRNFRSQGRGARPGPPKPKEWQREMLALAGYPDVELCVVRQQPVRVESLLVPVRPVVLKSWALPAAVTVWQRMGDAVGARGSDAKVFLSRSRFHAEQGGDPKRVRVSADWDELLDQTFADAGFTVVHPEQLRFAEQIEIARGAEVLAGSSGSALHLAVFARPGTRVLEIGDERNVDEPMPAQRLVDAACGHRSAFVPYGDADRLRAVLSTT